MEDRVVFVDELSQPSNTVGDKFHDGALDTLGHMRVFFLPRSFSLFGARIEWVLREEQQQPPV